MGVFVCVCDVLFDLMFCEYLCVCVSVWVWLLFLGDIEMLWSGDECGVDASNALKSIDYWCEWLWIMIKEFIIVGYWEFGIMWMWGIVDLLLWNIWVICCFRARDRRRRGRNFLVWRVVLWECLWWVYCLVWVGFCFNMRVILWWGECCEIVCFCIWFRRALRVRL